MSSEKSARLRGADIALQMVIDLLDIHFIVAPLNIFSFRGQRIIHLSFCWHGGRNKTRYHR